MTKYYYLKLGTGNCLAEYWLNPKGKRSIYEEYEHAAAIYFGRNTVEDIIECATPYEKGGASKKEALEKFKDKLNSDKDKTRKPDLKAAIDFVKAGDSPGNTKFITITHNKVYIYEPESKVVDLPHDKYREYDKDLSKLSKDKDAQTKRNIEEVKIFYDEPHCLSITDSEFKAELNKGLISEELKSTLEKCGCYAYNSVVTTKEDGKWEINGGNIFIERKDGELKVHSKIRNIPKIMPVRFLKGPFPIKKVPHVLASLPCNQHLTRGTFREIKPKKNLGAIQAIKHCLNEEIDKPKTFRELTNFLSSYELETLVFLILTNAGLFVPAWRGGTQKGFDMIAHNFTNSTIQIPSITFESEDNAKSSFTFQVKKGKVKKHSKFADFTIATEYSGDDDQMLNTNWLLKNIKGQKDTRDWFVNLLKWVGENEITSLIEK